MIRTEGLTKAFGRIIAVDGVSIHVRRRDIFGLVGPDGAGKTTLMRMICGLIAPDQGRVLIGSGTDRAQPVRNDLGYMPQRFSLYGDLTVQENLHFFGRMYGLSRSVIDQRADEILEITGLGSFKNRLADHLSGGMKQKLALTNALITRPNILVLDEPTYGVDPESRKEFWRILYRLNREGMTILVSTPYMDEAELCSMVAFLSNGRIKAVDTPPGLRASFGYRILEVRTASRDPYLFREAPGIRDSSFYGDKYHLVVDDLSASRMVRVFLAQKGVGDFTIREVLPSMEDVFVALAEAEVVQ